MYYSYVEIEYVATSFSPARTDLALKLLIDHDQFCDNSKTMTKNKIMTFSPVLIPR